MSMKLMIYGYINFKIFVGRILFYECTHFAKKLKLTIHRVMVWFYSFRYFVFHRKKIVDVTPK